MNSHRIQHCKRAIAFACCLYTRNIHRLNFDTALELRKQYRNVLVKSGTWHKLYSITNEKSTSYSVVLMVTYYAWVEFRQHLVLQA